MSDKSDLVLGGIHFGPPIPASERSVKIVGIGPSSQIRPAIRCMLKDCPHNKSGKCASSTEIVIDADGVCAMVVFVKTRVPKE